MPTDSTFRLSLYATLALACLCVGYAEHELFPEVPYIAAGVITALIVLYQLEGRVPLLTIPDANRLGLVVGLGNLVWAGYHLLKSFQKQEMSKVPLQLLIVALFGPLLMTLMPAKLARREKHVGDYWALQGAGLVAVCLSGAMTEDTVSFVLIGIYAVVAIWSLMLFYLHRSSGTIPLIPNRPSPPPLDGVLVNGPPRFGLGNAIGLFLIASAFAIPLYLYTPVSSASKLDFGKPRVEIGFAADQMVNLNHTGNLEGNPAPAFEFFAEDAKGPRSTLPPDILWRGRVLRQYANGTWQSGDSPLPSISGATASVSPWEPPQLSDQQCLITFAVPWELPAQFLAEPVIWEPNQAPPVATLTAAGPRGWLWVGDGSFLWTTRRPTGSAHEYVQVWEPNVQPNLSPVFQITDPDRNTHIRPLTHNPVPRVKEYADQYLEKLVKDGVLPKDYRDIVTQLPRRQFHDVIARSLSSHLANSSEFVYTTDLRRSHTDLDPIEEFLFHTKAGHCERFASGLALLLRSQGIPAVLVLGFKGWEPGGEPGRFVVRQENAHAWVDVLITDFEPPPPGALNRPLSCWRTLDPTPDREVTTSQSNEKWAVKAREWVKDLVRDYVTNPSPEQREHMINRVTGWCRQPEVIAPMVLSAGLFVGWRFRRRRVANRLRAADRSGPGIELLNQLYAVLAARGLSPMPEETPREFAARAADSLHIDQATAIVASVPPAWAEAYYEVRFGGETLSPERLKILDAGLRELEQRSHAR